LALLCRRIHQSARYCVICVTPHLIYQVKTNNLQQLKARLSDPVARKPTICINARVQWSYMVGSFLLSTGVSTLKSIKVGNRKKSPEFTCVMSEILLLHKEQIKRNKFFLLDTNQWDACIPQHVCEGLSNTTKNVSRYLVSEPRFKPGMSKIKQCYPLQHSTLPDECLQREIRVQ